jgi:hypothetical protein
MFPDRSKASSKATAIPIPLTSQSTFTTTTKTSSEILTPTTTGTTTQWFSLPYWRRRNVSQPTLPQHRSSERFPAIQATSQSARLLSVDKALPPTPSDEGQDSKNFGNPEILHHRSSRFPTYQQGSNTSDIQNALRSAPVPTLASRGLCISLASASAHAEANVSSPVIPNTLYPISSSVASNPSPQIRRTKSAHRLRASNDTVAREQLAERRCRGLSFGATNLLLIERDTKTKGKGKELEPSPNTSKALAQSLSRKPSFWSKKKTPTPATASPQNDSASPVLPLPLVDVSPFAPEFTIQPFQSSNPNTTPMLASPFQRLQPDSAAPRRTTPGSTTTSSTTSFEVVDAALPHQEGSYMSRSPRGHATPPLLHRLSFGVFSSPEPSPVVRPKFPNQCHSQSATALPFPSSPKPSTQIPRPSIDGESPEGYVLRLKTRVSKAEVASILASRYRWFFKRSFCLFNHAFSSDPFYTRALRAYLEQFEFSGIPLDVALRRFLMEVGLPRETQQIDRVMESFAFRYRQTNPNLFTLDGTATSPLFIAYTLTC